MRSLSTLDSPDLLVAVPSARSAMSRVSKCVVALLVLVIRCYQVLIRPFLAGSCKFCPTCSEYAVGAVSVHGVRRGLALALRRLSRCHPFSQGGIDPIPEKVRTVA